MSEDHTQAHARGHEGRTQGDAPHAQAAAAQAGAPGSNLEDRRPVKAGRAILLLAVAAIAVASAEFPAVATTRRN